MSSDRNKGDFAILAATIQGIRRLRPDSELTAISAELPTGAQFSGDTVRLTQQLDLKIIGTPVPSLRAHGGGRLGWLGRLLRGELSLLAIRLGRGGLAAIPQRDRTFFRALREADVVIAKGGSYLYSHGGLSEMLYLWRMVYPLRAAIAVGRPPTLLGVTLGPFRPAVTALLARRVLRRCSAVYVREEISAETAHAVLGLSAERVISIPDIAFSIDHESRGAESARPLIGLTVRDLPVHGTRNVEAQRCNYEDAIVAAGERLLVGDPAMSLVFIPQVLDDVALGLRLRKRFSDPARVDVIQQDLSVQELIEIYASLTALVATRLHSAILSAVAGTPIIHLVYEREKGLGIMASLGLEQWTMSSADLDGVSLARLILRLLRESEQVRVHLAARVPELRTEVNSAFEQVLA